MKLWKKLSRVACMLGMLCIAFLAISYAAEQNSSLLPEWGEVRGGTYASKLEQGLKANFPYRQKLTQLALDLKLAGGQRVQNQIYINKEGLLRNTDPPNKKITDKNTQVIMRFGEEEGIPTYLMLIPTASAVKQQLLPNFAQTYNQSRFIEDTYNQMSGKVTTVDAYNALFNKREEYVYYRTENNLTALGGYYVYTALGKKMGIENSSLNHFEIQYATDEYRGDLFQRSPYKEVRPDTLALYCYTRYPRDYVVTHHVGGEIKTYHTLYPVHLQEMDREMNVYFGGVSSITDFQIASPYSTRLLVFGDKTALSYLPFVVNHYQQVTLVDLFQLSREQAEDVPVNEYDQVLFAYSLETYSRLDISTRMEWILSI